jgi:DNA-binding NarL/FixJ family response regulator
MAKDICVLLVEDDIYSRNMMAMMLTRDWRTRVIGELDGRDDVSEILKQPIQQVDVILIGVESPGDHEWPFQILDKVSSSDSPPVVLYAGTTVDHHLSYYSNHDLFGGYVLKSEVMYSMATAVALSSRGFRVITPGVRNWLGRGAVGRDIKVIDGCGKVAKFSRRESEIVHLGIIFNLSQRDIADELVIGTDWISEAMGNIYEKLGIHEILSGQTPLDHYFEDELVLSHCETILDRARKNSRTGKLRKAPWMSTLAFHLLTTPMIEDY